MDTDLALLSRYHRDGDAAAFRSLLRMHAGMVFAVARRITQDAALAEEVAQDTFLALARRAQSVRESVAAWLHHVARQKACNALRGELRRQRRERSASEMLHGEAADTQGEWAAIEPVLDEVIEELPMHLRTLLIEHFLQQRTQEEIARRLGLNQSTVSRHLDTALERLRDGLKGRGVVCSVSLAGLLSAGTAHAVPDSLIATLGKLALTAPSLGTVAAAASTNAAAGPGTMFTLSLAAMTSTTKALLVTAALAAGSLPFLMPRHAQDANPQGPIAANAPEPARRSGFRPVSSAASPSMPAPASRAPVPEPETPVNTRRPSSQPDLKAFEAAITGTLDAAEERRLIMEEFARLGGAIMPTGEKVVDERIDKYIEDEFNNDRTAFERDLAAKGVTMEQFRTGKREEMIISIMRARAIKGLTDPAEKQRAIDAWLQDLRRKSASAERSGAVDPPGISGPAIALPLS